MNKAAIILIISAVIASIIFFTTQNVSAQGLGNCDASHLLKTESEPHIAFDGAHLWTKAIVKAGSQNQGDACFEFTTNSDDGCYSISGLGTNTAVAQKIGEGKDCKDISHVEWFGESEPSPSPSPSPEPSVDPTPSPSATPSATPTPSPSPTPEPTPSASPTPTSSPSVEQQQQQMIQEVKEENNGRMPEIGFK